MRPISLFTFLFFFSPLLSCNYNTKSGSELTTSEKDYLKSLGILDDNEVILLFDSQFEFNSSGNFVSNKRIASYWIDERDDSKNSIKYAKYEDIDSIATNDLRNSLTYASYIVVIKTNGEKFRVFVDGDSSEVWSFFNKAIHEWKLNTD